MLEDRELVEQVLQGNEQAYREIIERYKGKLVAYLYRMIGNLQDAQDLAQEVLIKAYYRLEQYKPDCKFSSWLYRIATNHCIDELRRRKQMEKVPLPEEELVFGETPETALLEKERQHILREQIMTLDADYRAVFLLYYEDHLSYKEISEVLSITISTVQMRLFRARKKLRERLKQTMKGGGVSELFSL